jgi:glycosyltransferase involved in cell wall biosynthesis
MSPKVSICIPTFNGERFLRATLSSLEAQTFADYDIIISDHGSTDETLNIVQDFSQRLQIHLVHCELGTSVADNWNNAVRHATGMYVKLLCQDDILYSDCLDTEVKVLDNHSTSPFCWSLRDIISPSSKVVMRARGWKPSLKVVRYEDKIGEVIRKGTNCFGEPEAVLIRTSAIQKTTGFSGEYEIDLRMWLTLWRHGPAVFTGSCLSAFRISASSWTSQLSAKHSKHYLSLVREIHLRESEHIKFVSVIISTMSAILNHILRNLFVSWWTLMNRVSK